MQNAIRLLKIAIAAAALTFIIGWVAVAFLDMRPSVEALTMKLLALASLAAGLIAAEEARG